MGEFIAIILAGVFIYWVWLGYTGRDKAVDSDSKSSGAKYPEMTMEMIDSGGKPINTATAVKLFKEFMLKVGYLDKSELTEHAEYFATEMKEHGTALTEDVTHEKEQLNEAIADIKSNISLLKKQMAASSDPARREVFGDEITDLQDDLEGASQEDLEYAQAAHAAFKADKRAFLVSYVNQQIH